MNAEERITRLERHNRALTAGVVALGLLALGVLAVGAEVERSVPDRIEAGAFVLVDESGAERGAFGVFHEKRAGARSRTGSQLVLSDGNGKQRLRLASLDDQTSLAMKNADGKTQVDLTAYSMRQPESPSSPELNFDQATLAFTHKDGPRLGLTVVAKQSYVHAVASEGAMDTGARLFSSSESTGFDVRRIVRKQVDGRDEVYIITDASLLRDDGVNLISVNDENGDAVWSERHPPPQD